MMEPFVVLLTLFICIQAFHAYPVSHDDKRHKKYVIEVQDHQQAMKYADPMIDLEETVRRGINDPLNDPEFIMNPVNQDFFHRNFAHDTSLYGGASPRQSIQTSMHSNAHVFNLTPQRAVAESAVKNSLLANPFLRLKPQRPVQVNAGKMGSIPHAPPLMRVLQNLLIARRNNKIHNQRFFANNNLLTSTQHKQIGETVNSLTGLPEDLESKSYGAITSIESVSDQPEHQPPQSVTVDINTASVKAARNSAQQYQQKPVSNRHRIQGASLLKKPTAKLTNRESSSVLSNTIGSNYDSIQSFLEADDILRKHLSDSANN